MLCATVLGFVAFAAVDNKPSLSLASGTKLKKRFSKDNLRGAVVVGLLPSATSVDEFQQAAHECEPVPFFHTDSQSDLEAAGLTGSKPAVQILRPWAKNKQYRATYRGAIKTDAFKEWILKEALEWPALVSGGLATVLDEVAGNKRKTIIRGLFHSKVFDKDDKEPDNWDMRQKIPKEGSELPEDWNEEDDGKWEPEMIANPSFKGTWHPRRISLMVPDPEHEKPEEWHNEPKIKDPKAFQPEDWDDEEDGEWQAEMVPNPDYTGAWIQKEAVPKEIVEPVMKSLKRIVEKFGDKYWVVAEDADSHHGFTVGHHHRFPVHVAEEGNAIGIEVPQYDYSHTTYKASTKWLRYSFPAHGKDLLEWIEDVEAGKVDDLAKIKRKEGKKTRLAKQAEKEKAQREEEL